MKKQLKSHPLGSLNATKAYDSIRTNLILSFRFLIASWGDCLDRMIHHQVQKRSPTIARWTSFLKSCDAEYTRSAIVRLDKFIPSKTKHSFLELLFTKYQTVIKPWVITELRKKPKHVKQTNKRCVNSQDAMIVQSNMLLSIHFFAKALETLFEYKDLCLQSEALDILKQSKPMELRLLRAFYHRKRVLRLLWKTHPILKPISEHKSVTQNIVQGRCSASDKTMIAFVDEMASIIINPGAAKDLSRHIYQHLKK